MVYFLYIVHVQWFFFLLYSGSYFLVRFIVTVSLSSFYRYIVIDFIDLDIIYPECISTDNHWPFAFRFDNPPLPLWHEFFDLALCLLIKPNIYFLYWTLKMSKMNKIKLNLNTLFYYYIFFFFFGFLLFVLWQSD